MDVFLRFNSFKIHRLSACRWNIWPCRNLFLAVTNFKHKFDRLTSFFGLFCSLEFICCARERPLSENILIQQLKCAIKFHLLGFITFRGISAFSVMFLAFMFLTHCCLRVEKIYLNSLIADPHVRHLGNSIPQFSAIFSKDYNMSLLHKVVTCSFPVSS